MATVAQYEAWKASKQQQDTNAAGAVIAAQEDSPDQVAADLTLADTWAKTTGKPAPPAPLMREYRNTFQQELDRQKNSTILSSAPRLSEWVRTPENAAIARDDLHGLSWWETTLGAAENAASRGVNRVVQGYEQWRASGALQRLEDSNRSFGDILDQERTIYDNAGVALDKKPLVGVDDLFWSATRFAQSRLAPALGVKPEDAALFWQQQAGRTAKTIAAIPMSPAGEKFKATFATLKPSGDWSADLGRFWDTVAVDPGGFTAFLSETAAETAPMLAAMFAATAATRSPAVGAITMGASSYEAEAGTSVEEFFREHKIDVSTPEGARAAITNPELMRQAIARGQTRGVIIGLMDAMSGGLAGKALAKSPVGNMALQAVAQAAFGAGGEAMAQVGARQEFNVFDVMIEGLAEFASAPVEVAAMGGHKAAAKIQSAREAIGRKALFEALSGNAQKSVLRNRVPEKFRDFVARATADGPVENVYVPAEQFVTYFQSKGLDPYALVDTLDGVTRDDLDAARAGGGDLQIPTSTYAAKIAGSEHDAFLIDNMRFDPDQMTAAEAADFNLRAGEALDEAWREAERLRAEAEQSQSFEGQIFDEMRHRLRAAGRSADVAETEAALFPAFYRVMAERSGMAIDEYMARYPLPQVDGAIPQGMRFKNVDDLNRLLAEARTAKGEAKRGPSLLEFIDSYGGIHDAGGELRARDAAVIKRGRGKKTLRLARVTGGEGDLLGGPAAGGRKHGVDDVALAAIEAGYLADDPVANEYRRAIQDGGEVPDIGRALLDAIDRELQGDAQRAGSANNADADHARKLADIEGYLASLGVSLDDSDATIRAAVDAESGRVYGQASKNKGSDTPTGSDGRTALFDRIAADWAAHVDSIFAGTARRNAEILRKSPVLAAVVGGTGRIELGPIVAKAVRAKHPDIPLAVWRALPALIADPVAVFVRQDGNANVLLDARTAAGSPIVVGIRDGEVKTITPVDDWGAETSADRVARMLTNAAQHSEKIYIKDGGVLADARSLTGATSRADAHKGTTAFRQGRNAKIITRADIVKTTGRIFYQGPRGQIQFPAAGVGHGETIIRLFERADLSTLLHESGHYFLTIMQDMAARGDEHADAEMATVRAWWRENAAAIAADAVRAVPNISVTESDVIVALDGGTTGDTVKDGAIDAGMQEQWARAFESYLMEGKAPSIELRGAFERFRAWLVSIYRKLAGLNVTPSDALKSVFDRMLATDDEIAKAKAEVGPPLGGLTTAEELGLTDEEFQRFDALRRQADDSAKAKLLRDVMAPIRRAREAWFKRERQATRSVVEREVNAHRVYRALEWMGNRRWLGDGQPTNLPDMRLSRAALVERYGEGVLKTLPRGKQTVYAVDGGLDPDEAAGWFGYDSGDEMIRALERAPARRDAIEAETDRAMNERHGDVLNDGSVEAAAIDAVHGDKAGQLLGAELKAMSDVAGVDVGMTWKQACASARATVQRMRVRDAMNANRFLSAERKAGEDAARLGARLARDGVWLAQAARAVETKARRASKGSGTVAGVNTAIDRRNTILESRDVETTVNGQARTVHRAGYNETAAKMIDAKRRQMLNHALYSEARSIADDVERAENFVAGLNKKAKREKLAGAGRREDAQVDYLAAIDEILDQYDFRKLSAAGEQRRGALLAFVDGMKAAGRENELAIPDDVLTRAARVPYKTLAVEELRGVVATLKNLEHVALRWDAVIDERNKRLLSDSVDGIVAAFAANVATRPPGRVRTKGEAARNTGRQFLNLVLNATTLLREIDGFADQGAAYQAIKAPIDAAASRLIQRKQKAAIDLEALYEVYSKDERRQMQRRDHMPALGYSLSKWERIAVALNLGNEGNRQRLTDSKVRGSLTEDQVAAVVATLDARDADFVQSVWDYVGSFRDDIAARERRVTGVEPDWVEASPVTIAGKTLRGGYYPIKYDPRLTSLSRDDAAQDVAASLAAGRFGKAQTRSGHLKERAQSSGRAVDLDISVLHRHVNQVIYDLEMGEPVAHSWRILQNDRIRGAFIDSGKQADYDALEIWLKDVAEGELKSADFIGRASRTLKSNFTAAKLAFNLSTVAMQVTGLAQSMIVVGKRDFLRGVQGAFRSGVLSDITAKSAYMSTRQTTFNKDVFDMYSDSTSGPAATRWVEARNKIASTLGFWLMTKVQWHVVDVPTWLAGYEQGLRRFGGDEDRAVAHADDVVKRAQASGLFSDRSAIERGSVTRAARQNDVVRLFTALGSYMFAKFNVAYERSAKAGRVIREEGASVRALQEGFSWALDMGFLFTLEAVLTAAIKGGLPGGDGDDDDGWSKFLARETAMNVMSSIPFVRDVGSVLSGFDGGGAYGAITKELSDPIKQISQGEVDRGLVRSAINATGLATGLPATQINRAVSAAWRSTEGEDVSPIEFLMGARKK